MSIGFWQIAIVVVLVVLLFGRGKISSLMGDVAKGIKSFKKGISEKDESSNTIPSSEETTNTIPSSQETTNTIPSSEETTNKDPNPENK